MQLTHRLQLVALGTIAALALAGCGGGETASGDEDGEVIRFAFAPDPVWDAAKSAFTMMGAATVIADVNSPSANSELVARLLDVAPDGQESLVNRAILRPAIGNARQVFQLHPNGWEFAEGHVPKLELLPRDTGSSILASYARQANNPGQVTISNLELRLPVLQKVGGLDGYVKVPAAKVVPSGYELAKDFANLPSNNEIGRAHV